MKVTGIITPTVYLSYTTKIVLQFSSDAAVNKRGFRVGIEFVQKGQLANFIHGQLCHKIFLLIQKVIIARQLIFLDKKCPKNYFICGNGRCLTPTEICDGRDNCGDNTDEGTICSGKTRNFIFDCSQLIEYKYINPQL